MSAILPPDHEPLNAPIGVFDSGVGGLSVLSALRAELPCESFIYFADSGYAPYGERDDAYVIQRARTVLATLRADHGIKALVIACNTATAAAVHLLRAENPDLPIVGVEPALKPAVAASRTGYIGVLATRGTLGSQKFAALLSSLAHQAVFRLQPCDGLADAIERQDTSKTIALCDRYTKEMGSFGNEIGEMDTLVLGCTHYPFAADALRARVGTGVRLIDTGEPVARRMHQLLKALHVSLRSTELPSGTSPSGAAPLTLISSGPPNALQSAVRRWLGLDLPVRESR